MRNLKTIERISAKNPFCNTYRYRLYLLNQWSLYVRSENFQIFSSDFNIFELEPIEL